MSPDFRNASVNRQALANPGYLEIGRWVVSRGSAFGYAFDLRFLRFLDFFFLACLRC